MSKETDESQSGTIEMNEIPNEKGTSLKYNRAPPYGVPKRSHVPSVFPHPFFINYFYIIFYFFSLIK